MSLHDDSQSLTSALDKERSKVWLYALGAFVLVFSVTFIVLYLIERQLVKNVSSAIRESEAAMVSVENDYISEDISRVIGDLLFLEEGFNQEILNNDFYFDIERKWSAFSVNRAIYDQIRYIDADGQERIRINYDGINAHPIPGALLQNKKDRNYFYETAALPQNHIFISRLDLNIERGEIEQPEKPVLRFAMPVYDLHGKSHGIIVINYLAEQMLNNFNRLALNSTGALTLLNTDSYWLVGDKQHQAWNFMYPERQGQNFAAMHPEVWSRFTKDHGQILTDTSFFTYSKLDLTKRIDHRANFYRDKIHLEGGDLVIVSEIARDTSNESLFAVKDLQGWTYILKKHAFLFILLYILSVAAGIAMYARRRSFIKIKYYSEYDPLTGAYNRRAGIARINEIVPTEERRERNISVCFIDVNGLKLVNDNLGHEHGDELILSVVKGIKDVIRASDILIRLGGDEFLIVFVGIDEVIAEKVWQRIQARYAAINEEETRPYTVSVSHGIVSHKYLRQTLIDDLIREADEKMYAEKQIIKQQVDILRHPVPELDS